MEGRNNNKTIKHWQNLIHQKCPACNTRMGLEREGLICPEKECKFYITRIKLAEILADSNHAVVRFATKHEAEILNNAFKSIGISNIWADQQKKRCGNEI